MITSSTSTEFSRFFHYPERNHSFMFSIRNTVLAFVLIAFLLSSPPLKAKEESKKKQAIPAKDDMKKAIEKFKKRPRKKPMPPQVLKIFAQGIEKVRQSEAMKQAVKKGDTAPDFTLPSTDGKKVRLKDLLKKGPVVIVWYRGAW